jgi:predicted ribosomally synthesized peptide with nif11-like leader
MSIAEIERFAADLKANEALRAEVEAYAKRAQPESGDGLVALAGARGYLFTAIELHEIAKASAATADKVIPDAELDGVSGGFGSHPFQMMMGALLLGGLGILPLPNTPTT